MKPYGVKRNWNEVEDYVKKGRRKRRSTQGKDKRMLHRKERRTSKHTLKLEIE
jgi:hypothetical protein